MNEQTVNANSYSQKDLDTLQRMHSEVMEYLVANKRTYQEEYELVQQKKSSLSKRGRDYVTLLAVYEQHKANEQEADVKDDTNNEVLKQAIKDESAV